MATVAMRLLLVPLILVIGLTTIAPAGAAASKSKKVHIAFFGISTANSFTQAAFKGIRQEASKMHATATIFGSNFTPATQVQQIEDATTTGAYQVFVIQADDGVAVIPAVNQAIAKGIIVVADYTAIGPKTNTAAPQIPGVISVVNVPTKTGAILGKLAIQACGTLPQCNVAALEFSTLPLDAATLASELATLATDKNVTVVSSTIVGGFLQSSGKTAAATLFTANQNVNVVTGSTQAMEGLYPVAQQLGLTSLKIVGRGCSYQAVNAVKSGRWSGIFCDPEVTEGALAAKYGIEDARGQKVPATTINTSFAPNGGFGTTAALKHLHFTGQYSDY